MTGNRHCSDDGKSLLWLKDITNFCFSSYFLRTGLVSGYPQLQGEVESINT